MKPPGTRARLTLYVVGSGSLKACAGCGERIELDIVHGLSKTRYVLCNVYVGDRWDRIEHWDETCYRSAGEPHGPARRLVPPRKRRYQTGHLSRMTSGDLFPRR